MSSRHFITLLKNDRLELRQVFNSYNQLVAFELGNITQRDAFNAHTAGQSSWRFAPLRHFILSFFNFLIVTKSLHLSAAKQLQNGQFFRNLMTGHNFHEFPQYPRDVRRHCKMGRRTRCRGRLGSDNAVQMVGWTEGLGTTAEVVGAEAISEPINATNRHQTTVCPVVARITHPAGDRRSTRRVRCAKDKRPSKCSAKMRTAKRGGGGRSRAGRRRRDRSELVENFSQTN